MNHWYETLRGRVSLGRSTERPGSLAGLHEARKLHLGQFFTPDVAARFLWQLATPAMTRKLAECPKFKIPLLDTSVGSGRLFQFADPETHTLSGVDVHRDSVDALVTAARGAGFDCTLLTADMQSIRCTDYAVGLLNPPFSIHLESPLLQAGNSTSFGRFGPNTSAMSHAYAIDQALAACDIVCAIVPRSFAGQILADRDRYPRLCAVFHLPPDTFAQEGARVDVSVLVFDCFPADDAPLVQSVTSFELTAPDLGLTCRSTRELRPRLNNIDLVDDGPVITLPVTGSARVRVTHQRRRIVLRFDCGLTQARVMNALLRERVPPAHELPHRLPKGVRFVGEGALDIDVHLLQDDPQASFGQLMNSIERAGGAPVVDLGLSGYFARRLRQLRRHQVPLRHSVYFPEGAPDASGIVVGVARKTFVVNPKIWGSPVVRTGDPITFTPGANRGTFTYVVREKRYLILAEDLRQLFEISTGARGPGWSVVHEGRRANRPDLAKMWRARAAQLGIDQWLTWEYQLDDLVELTLSPLGSNANWTMGLGKTRLALALVLLSGCRHGLICVEPGLVPELVAELAKLPLSRDLWQVIQTPDDVRQLRRVNIISYTRARAPISAEHPRRTYASLLRRRIGVLIADEGELLRNYESDQSRALRRISARKRFILTGTIVANYPRDVLPQLVFVAGDGNAFQPYGFYGPYLQAFMRDGMTYARRGIDKFREDFITLEWVTNEFAESLSTGAKREIPRIKNVPLFREALSLHVKRRVLGEPDVARHVNIPKPQSIVTTIDMDDAHLAYYLKVAGDFVDWYSKQRLAAQERRQNVNLVAVLARIGAVTLACNYPQGGVRGFGAYGPLTAKQRYLVGRVATLVTEGHKVITYVENPGATELLARALTAKGIDTMVFHGGRPIAARTAELRQNFRNGTCPALLATLGVTQKGLNIPEADRVLFGARAWTAREEQQALARVLRPEQRGEPVAEWVNLRGSIDEYQAQMVAFKADAANAGVDWGTPEFADAEFLHLDTILGKFCDQIAALRGLKGHELRRALQMKSAMPAEQSSEVYV